MQSGGFDAIEARKPRRVDALVPKGRPIEIEFLSIFPLMVHAKAAGSIFDNEQNLDP